MMTIKKPYLLFIGDAADDLAIKMAKGVLDWRPELCLGQFRLQGCEVKLPIKEPGLEEAVRMGAQTMVIGVVNAGGVLPEHWIAPIVQALHTGLDVAAGLHKPLAEIKPIADAARANGRTLHDIRLGTQGFATGKGVARSGKRLLTVGTDCSVGKKYAALALTQALRALGEDVHFCATGQTGVLIAERGIAIDAVVSDFISGAVEWLSPAADPDHIDVIEGQGSLFHPSFAGVSLGLLHGAQPDGFVVCHEPTRTTMRGVSHPLPSIAEVIKLTMQCGRLTNPDIRCVGICVNTEKLSVQEAQELLHSMAQTHDLPACDPIRFGMDDIVALLRQTLLP